MTSSMKVVKWILGVIGGLFALLCVFVMVCAFNPALTEKIAAVFAGWEDDKPGMVGGNQDSDSQNDASQNGDGQSVAGEDVSGGDGAESVSGGDVAEGTGSVEPEPEVLPVIEEGYDEDGIWIPDPDGNYYLLPDPEVVIPQNVAGKNGFIPVEESMQKPGQGSPSGAADYGKKGENLTFDKEFYPYYHMLSEALQRVYRQVYANAEALKETFTPLEKLTPEQMQNVMEAVYNDHPELFWLDTAYSCRYTDSGRCGELTLKFNRTADRLEDNRREFTKAVNEIIAGAVNYTTDFEKERYVHDALLGRVEYRLASQEHQSAYSALVNRETVCAGYSKAFQHVMQQLGIPCYYSTGYAGENHAWNIVKLDGRYYNVDVTWDDTKPDSYDYFNRTDADFAETHIRKRLSVYLPVCDGTKYRNATGKERPNKWQNTTGNETDNSGETFLPDGKEPGGDGESYDGEMLTTLQDYYDNCYSQLSKGGIGTVKFQNVVDSETLEAIYEAYNKEEYNKGYIDKTKEDWDADWAKVSIRIVGLEEGKYLLTHTVEMR